MTSLKRAKQKFRNAPVGGNDFSKDTPNEETKTAANLKQFSKSYYTQKLNSWTGSRDGQANLLTTYQVSDSMLDEFYLDSGASAHVVGNRAALHDYVSFGKPVRIQIANGDSILVVGEGKLCFQTELGVDLVFYNVGYAPSIVQNLLNPRVLLTNGDSLTITDNYISHSVLGKIGIYDHLMKLTLALIYPPQDVVCSMGDEQVNHQSALELHNALGHPSFDAIERICGHKYRGDACEVCLKAKMVKVIPKLSTSNTHVSGKLELLHVDLAGPFEPDVHNFRYFMIILDDVTSMRFVILLKNKFDAVSQLIQFIHMQEKQHYQKSGARVVRIRTDNGGEFVNSRFQSFCREHFIIHETTIPRQSFQNGRAERSIRIILDKMRAMHLHSSIPYSFWSYAALYAVCVTNVMVSKDNNQPSPYELWHDTTVDYLRFHPFGCGLVAHVPAPNRHKLEPNGVAGIFLGFPLQQHGYLFYNCEQHDIQVASVVKFYDNMFPVKNGQVKLKTLVSETATGVTRSGNSVELTPSVIVHSFPQEDIDATETEISSVQDSLDVLDYNEVFTDQVNQFPQNTIVDNEQIVQNFDDHGPDHSSGEDGSSNMLPNWNMVTSDTYIDLPVQHDTSSMDNDGTIHVSSSCEGEETENRTNEIVNYIRVIDGLYQDDEYLRGTINYVNTSASELKRIKIFSSQEVENELANTVFMLNQNYVFNIPAEEPTPKTYRDVLLSKDKEKWLEAMQREWEQLKKNDTFMLVDRPKNEKILGTKWVFTRKQNQLYKARLVALGNFQESSVFQEYYAPVIRGESIKIVLALSALAQLKVHQMDVESAFLNATITETVYLKQPAGMEDKNYPDKVLKLRKSIYGLRQSPKLWNETISEVLKRFGFDRLKSDMSIYIRNQTIVALYVDDMLICSRNVNEIEDVKNMLKSEFAMKDLSEAKKFIGLNIFQGKNEILVNLQDYIDKILREYHMEDCNPVSTPMSTGIDVTKVDEMEEDTDVTSYRSLIGKLLFAASTVRMDISYAVSILSRFNNNPKKKHYQWAKHVLRYLKGTRQYGLTFKKDNTLAIYCDADWASSTLDRRLISGYLFQLAHAPILWKSKRQPCVALSSTEAELISLAECLKDLKWILKLFKEMQIDVQFPLTVFEDNRPCIALIENPTSHSHTKHIDVKYWFITDMVQQKIIKLVHKPTSLMIADILTKALPKKQHHKLRELAGIENVSYNVE